MHILSFDTSGPDLQIALAQDETILFAQLIPPAQKNRQEAASVLLPSIDAATKSLGWKKSDIDLVVVGTGPGSFTGVRVAVITARSIGQALNCGVIGINTLEVLAFASERPSAVVLNAGAGKLYVGAYAQDLFTQENGGQLFAPFCGDADECRNACAAIDQIVLEADLEPSIPGSDKRFLPFPSGGNSAAAAAIIASRRIHSMKLKRESLAKAYPWDNVLPLYLRSPSVTLKAPPKAIAQTSNGSPNKTTAN